MIDRIETVPVIIEEIISDRPDGMDEKLKRPKPRPQVDLVVRESLEAETDDSEKVLEEESEQIAVASEPMIAEYVAYSDERFNELFESKTFAIYFHADWCGTCHSFEAGLQKSLPDMPPNFVMLRANYDTERALKEKYSVFSQTTVIIIDETGKKVYKGLSPRFEAIANYF